MQDSEKHPLYCLYWEAIVKRHSTCDALLELVYVFHQISLDSAYSGPHAPGALATTLSPSSSMLSWTLSSLLLVPVSHSKPAIQEEQAEKQHKSSMLSLPLCLPNTASPAEGAGRNG